MPVKGLDNIQLDKNYHMINVTKKCIDKYGRT